MRFGVNHTPRHGWFHSWLDLDLSEIQRDFDSIAALGLDHVRIFPLWPLLQPNRTLIRDRALDDVASVVRAAHIAGLDVVVDVLQGHLSSYDFLPSWVSSWHRENLFSSERILDGQRNLVAALGQRLRNEPGMLGLSIGNEFIQFAAERHPEQHPTTAEGAHVWLDTLLAAARTSYPEGLHTHSYDDDLFFDPTHPFTPAHAVGLGDVTTVHSWVFAHLGPHVGVDHPSLTTFARYLCELAVAWAPDPNRPVWLQEVGAPITHVTPERSGEFVTETLQHVIGLEQLWGVTWWCSHDVSRRLADFPELEYSLGLFDSDGQLKDAGRALRDFTAGWQQPTPPATRTALVFDGANLADARRITSPTGDLFGSWSRAALRGEPPALVAASRATDPHHLASRGLTTEGTVTYRPAGRRPETVAPSH